MAILKLKIFNYMFKNSTLIKNKKLANAVYVNDK